MQSDTDALFSLEHATPPPNLCADKLELKWLHKFL